jgi:cytochrome c-type biogenesis protein CcsB
MAELSDQFLVIATLGYLIAMICHAVEYSLAGAMAPARRAAARERRVLVGAGVGGAGPVAGEPGTESAESVDQTPAGSGRGAELAGRVALGVTTLATVALLVVLVTRGVAAERVPLGNMYEFTLAASFIGAVGWLFTAYRWPSSRQLGLFLTLAVTLLLAVAGMVLYSPIEPLMPALESYWFEIHITSVVLSSGVFLFGVVPAAMYLIRNGYEQGRRSFPYTLGRRSPAAEVLERVTFRIHAFAFPLFTFGVIAGAVWAEVAWGRPWGWDPKETWAFISWVVYAGYLHARATPSVKRSVTAWIAILGFVTMLVNLFGVNFFATDSLHSYANVD